VIVHQTLDFIDLVRGQWLIMTEVKTQIVGRYNRARLFDMRPQHFAQRCVHQVRRRVIASRCVAFFNIDFRRNDVPNLQSSLFNPDLMNNQPLGR